MKYYDVVFHDVSAEVVGEQAEKLKLHMLRAISTDPEARTTTKTVVEEGTGDTYEVNVGTEHDVEATRAKLFDAIPDEATDYDINIDVEDGEIVDAFVEFVLPIDTDEGLYYEHMSEERLLELLTKYNFTVLNMGFEEIERYWLVLMPTHYHALSPIIAEGARFLPHSQLEDVV